MSEMEDTEKTSKWDPQKLPGVWGGGRESIFWAWKKSCKVSMNEDGFVGTAQGDRGN